MNEVLQRAAVFFGIIGLAGLVIFACVMIIENRRTEKEDGQQ